jgi:cellulose biosynthesis protein BcsQ
MTPPVVAFFNNKGGVGKTTLVYHLAWMLNELGLTVVALDLDPQANLTASFLDDDRIEELWSVTPRGTVYGALSPLFEGEGGVGSPHMEEIRSGLWLVPGDLRLSGTEQQLGQAWADSLSRDVRAFRVTTAFATIGRLAAAEAEADILLIDVGPNLGTINRAAMVASDHVVVPMAPDLYSLQGLQNLGPTLRTWRQDWLDRVDRTPRPDLDLPDGDMRPVGYVILQHGVRVDRVVGAYDRWLQQVPAYYRQSVLDQSPGLAPPVTKDRHCLGLLKHYHSLVPLGQEARKPVFFLKSADGAIGAHQRAVREAYGHFEALARRLLHAIKLPHTS